MTSNESRHHWFLTELCLAQNLKKIGIDPDEVLLIIKEPEIYDRGRQQQAPDILILTRNHQWFVVELKGCKRKKAKALSQIHSGFRFLRTLGIRHIIGKFVIYDHHQGYKYENIQEQLEML